MHLPLRQNNTACTLTGGKGVRGPNEKEKKEFPRTGKMLWNHIAHVACTAAQGVSCSMCKRMNHQQSSSEVRSHFQLSFFFYPPPPPPSLRPCLALFCFPYFFIAGASSEVSRLDYPHTVRSDHFPMSHTWRDMNARTQMHVYHESQWTMPKPSRVSSSAWHHVAHITTLPPPSTHAALQHRWPTAAAGAAFLLCC